ncbi:MAG: hypothetical protein HQM10_00880 [Candidatus Riflebacteria bacterium]|nr:hypothetical protein [Candidatus Riflebacteria bacterium]
MKNGNLMDAYRRFTAAYTLLEAAIVLAMLSAIIFFSVPTIELYGRYGQETQLKAALQETRSAIDRYRDLRNEATSVDSIPPVKTKYPPSIASLLEVLPASWSRTGATEGPFLGNEPINYFVDKFGSFRWHLRTATSDQWVMTTDAATRLDGWGIFDIKYASWPDEYIDPQFYTTRARATAMDGSQYWDW